nr:YjbE family putative metal transport protein [Lysinibacillus timonensis]
MEILSAEFLSSLMSIILINLILAGDNALLIGLAAKNLPKQQQKQAVFLGTIGAIVVRLVLTIVAVKLLEIDGLLLIGGVLLVFIAFKLLISDAEPEIHSKKHTLLGALSTIIVADVLMGVDNVIAVAGAAKGDILLITIGLIISIPIVVWGSTLVIKLIEKFPIIIMIGSGVLTLTAADMIVKDTYVKALFHDPANSMRFELIMVIVVLYFGLLVRIIKGKKGNKNAHSNA